MKNSVDLIKQVATVEGAFVLKPPNRIQLNRQSVPVDLQPTVGVAVSLKREEADAEVYKMMRYAEGGSEGLAVKALGY